MAATLEIGLSNFDLNEGVDFAGVRMRLYLNVPMPLNQTRPWVEVKVGRLEGASAYGATGCAVLPVTAEQMQLVAANAQLGPGQHDTPTLVIEMLHDTRNLVGQACSVEQGVAIIPLIGSLGVRTVAAFNTTYMHYNKMSAQITTARGVPSSASIACTVALTLRTANADHIGVVGAPSVCSSINAYAAAIKAGVSGSQFASTITEYYRTVGRRQPLRRNLEVISFATYVENGCTLPGYMYYQTLERQAVEDSVIEQAVLIAALALAPAPSASAADALAGLKAYLAGSFAKQNPCALFQSALQLPAVACVYIQDEVELPRDFASRDMVTVSDGHRYGQTDTYIRAAVTGSDDPTRPTASSDCEDESGLTLDMGLAAQAYVLAHYKDPPGTLSATVAHGLAPVLAYVPTAAHCSLDNTNPDSHMTGVYVLRRLLPPAYQEPPWGWLPWRPDYDDRRLPSAVYMDSTYFTPLLPCTPVGAAGYSEMFSALVAGTKTVESHINVTDQPWLKPTNPAQRFMVARLFCDVRSLQTGRADWMAPVLDPHSATRAVPMFIPCDRRKPNTYGLMLSDLCLRGDECAQFEPHCVEPRKWAEMLLLLAWRHPPIPLRMAADRTILCELVSGSNRARDLVLPLVVRNSSYTPEREQHILRCAASAWGKRPFEVWKLRATLNHLSGAVTVVTLVY